MYHKQTKVLSENQFHLLLFRSDFDPDFPRKQSKPLKK